MKILFIGGTIRGFELLKMLIERQRHIVYACIMKEDSHEKINVSGEMAAFCKKHGIPSKICRKLSRFEARELLRRGPEVAFVCGWRSLLPAALYKRISLGCIAAHDSLLPRYRGFAPLNWAIINGESYTGVTLFKIQEGPVDSGQIFKQKIVRIGRADSVNDVYLRIVKATIELYKVFLSALENNKKIKWRRQDESKASYGCKRTPEDGRINWDSSAKKIFDLIRALIPPYPGAWTKYKGKKIVISSASWPRKQLRYAGNIPGRVVSILKTGVLVSCGCGQVIIHKVIDSRGKSQEAKLVFGSLKSTLGR